MLRILVLDKDSAPTLNDLSNSFAALPSHVCPLNARQSKQR